MYDSARMFRSARATMRRAAVATVVVGSLVAPPAWAAGRVKMDPAARPSKYDSGAFGPDPSYRKQPYSARRQLLIYGGKKAVQTPRPMIELGREIYRSGPLQGYGTRFGALNPQIQSFYVYGDWRTALAYNDNGNDERGRLATRLNLDLDYRLTATERVHGAISPLDEDGQFTRCDFGGDAGSFNSDNCELELDEKPDTLFFEGDAGAIYSGFSGSYSRYDLPFTFGLIPLLFQNGVWLEDAFLGAAATVPALNSSTLDISNMDITFFAGFDDVTTKAINGGNAEDNTYIYGATTFIEAMQGYWEVGYGYVDAQGKLSDQSYHNATVAFTRRYFGRLSNSVRVIGNFGQEFRDANGDHNADGYAVLIENSWVSSRPYTLVPYLNLFVGIDKPQSLARAGGAGGILKNTGINFETDGLTGFPFLDDTANDTYGGALGVSYLFNFNQQIVVEAATVQTIGDDNAVGRSAKGPEYAVGIRYQIPLDKAWLVRMDAMFGYREEDKDIAGARIELRRKF